MNLVRNSYPEIHTQKLHFNHLTSEYNLIFISEKYANKPKMNEMIFPSKK